MAGSAPPLDTQTNPLEPPMTTDGPSSKGSMSDISWINLFLLLSLTFTAFSYLVPLNLVSLGLSLCCNGSGFLSFTQQAAWEQCEITIVVWTRVVKHDGCWRLIKLVLLPGQLLGIFSVSLCDLHGSKHCICPPHASLSLSCNLEQGEKYNEDDGFYSSL